ncbi:hypothetical protein BC828DRAFT_391698 [Blastocladiella britannica]|nr:hypothetical protein BC828DRAFT_391698 [Blastocladiella britannica]
MIIEVASHILDLAVAFASSAREIVHILHVLPRADTPPLTHHALGRGFAGLDPHLAAKHGHAQLLLPMYPRVLVLDHFQSVLSWIMHGNDQPMLDWCWTHFGRHTIARNIWTSRETCRAVGSAGHTLVLEWFLAHVPNTNPKILKHVQAAAAQSGHHHTIEWYVRHQPAYMFWDWIGPNAAEGGHQQILTLWWAEVCQGPNIDKRRLQWLHVMNTLAQHGHLDVMDWLWAEGCHAWHIELSDMLRLYAKRTADKTTQVRVLDWIVAHFVSHDAFVCHQFGTELATYLLQQGRCDLVEWVMAHLDHPMFYGFPPVDSWGPKLDLHSDTTLEYVCWWWETSTTHNWTTEWVCQINYFAGIAGRRDLLDWAWNNARDLIELDVPFLLKSALKLGHESILEWIWARREQLCAAGRPRLASQVLIHAARHGHSNVLTWWHTHWRFYHRDWMHILHEATRYNHLDLLAWWRDNVLAERPRTSAYFLSQIEFLLETSSSIPVITFWYQFATTHGQVPGIWQCQRALVTASNLGSIACLEWWFARQPADLVLCTARLAFKHALERNRRTAVEWWIEYRTRTGAPISIPDNTRLQFSWQL